MALKRKKRLNLRLHRQRVEADCQKHHSPLFTYIVAGQPTDPHLDYSRFAILTSKKFLKKAVDRNKVKRKISKAIEDSFSSLPSDKDVILIPKRTVLDKSSSEIEKDLKHVLSI
jgi:ribonuclease P protein component